MGTLNNIHKKRIARGWTQTYLGELLGGLTKSAVHSLEKGKRKPSYDVLINLCYVFDVDTTEVQRLFKEADNDDADKPILPQTGSATT